MITLGFILLFVIHATKADEYPLDVTLPFGQIHGHIEETINQNKFRAFEGIPFAEPPIKDLRFEEPLPIKSWEGILEANTLYKCIQYDHYTEPGEDFVKGTEDCLYLNIYTPLEVSISSPKNVIVYIHGGAFMFNAPSRYGPKIILDHDVIYVSFNYRLGPLGFLSTEDKVVPGNNGLKDQLLALKWIKENIEYFGGNPDSITLTGMSAGGASVQLHALSPLSAGLFHRGFAQSGTALNSWVLMEKSLEKSKKLAENLNCPTSSTRLMIDCLKSKSAYDVTASVNLFLPWLYNPFSPFGVVVDKWSPKPIVPQHPYIALKNKKVHDIPFIFSNVAAEGLYPAADFIGEPKYLKEINERWDELIPHILDFEYTLTTDQKFVALQEIRDFYFQGKSVSKNTFPTLVKLLSDRLFVADIDKAARMHSAAVTSPVYYYYFGYRGAHSKSELRSHSNTNYGAAHGDDTVYVLNSDVDTQTTDNDKEMSKLLINMWTSYANNSTPTLGNIKLSQLSKSPTDPLTYTLIKSPKNIKVKESIYLGNRQFWDTLPFNENENLVTIRDEL